MSNITNNDPRYSDQRQKNQVRRLVQTIDDPNEENQLAVLKQLKEALETVAGERGPMRDRGVSMRDLEELGLITVRDVNDDVQNNNIMEASNARIVALEEATGTTTVVTGTIFHYAGTTAPTGYLLCDGSSVSTTTYADLFGVIAYTFGGSGASFNVPDLRGRQIVALDNLGGSSANRITATAADTLGGTSGGETHTLTSVNQLPAHNHGGGNHSHSITNVTGIRSNQNLVNFNVSSDADQTDMSTANSGTIITTEGSSSPIGNLDPYMALGAIIKI